jgi:poly(3-hydroxybutyrate) depolymerase
MLIMQAQISATIAEVPTLVDALVTDYNADPARISVVGVSMGAFLVYRLLLTALPIRSAVALLGAPDDLPSAELVHAAQRVTLLSITAEHDVNVPPHETVALHKALGVQAQHHVLRGSGHLTSAEHWHEAMQHTERWLDDHAR